jgi:hypothetical protein
LVNRAHLGAYIENRKKSISQLAQDGKVCF